MNASHAGSSSAGEDVYTCEQCGGAFSRREHLDRHILRHSGARPYDCPVCEKVFSRRDTLKRHVSTHGEAGRSEYAHTYRRTRACQACARAKQRCDGRAPCQSCQDKGRECVYPGAPSPSAPADRSLDPASTWIDSLDGATGDDSSNVPEALVGLGLNSSDMPWTSVWDDFLLYTQGPAMNFPLWPIPDHVGEMAGSTGLSLPGMPPNAEHASAVPDTYNPAGSGLSEGLEDSLDEDDILTAENFYHVPTMADGTYLRIHQFLQSVVCNGDPASSSADHLPSASHLNVYVQLYFEFFDPRLPILHKSTFITNKKDWLLVLAVAAVGCLYSASDRRASHKAVFERAAWLVLASDCDEYANVSRLAHAQSLLIMQHLLLFDGSRKSFLRVQKYRNSLVSTCRQLASADGSMFFETPSNQNQGDEWLCWVQEQEKRRLICFTCTTEYLYPVMFAIPPLTDAGELRVRLPCSEQLWQASSHEEWQELRSAGTEMLAAPSLSEAVNSIDTAQSVPQDLSQSALLVVALHCFAQRAKFDQIVQTTTNTDPSMSAQGTVASLAQQMRSHFDGLVAKCSSQIKTGQELPGLSNDHSTLACVFNILNFTPLLSLNACSGWQTTSSGMVQVKKTLLEKIVHEPKRTRECLVQAAQLYGRLRKAAWLAHFDPLCILVAVLYIWMYIDLAIPQQAQLDDAAFAPGTPSEVVRIDQALSELQRERWCSYTAKQQPHITGIGLLSDRRSLQRLHKEASRIMAASARRSGLAAGLSAIFASTASGQLPTWEGAERYMEGRGFSSTGQLRVRLPATNPTMTPRTTGKTT